MFKSIIFLKKGINACTHYRVDLPSKHLSSLNFNVILKETIKAEDLIDVSESIFVFGRACSYDELNLFREIKQRGAKVVYELDDNLLDLPSSNPATIFYLSKQGYIRSFIREADHVIVTNSSLKKALQNYNQKISCVDNYLDLDYLSIEATPNLFDKHSKKLDFSVFDGRFVILWAGSITHRDDLRMLSKQLLAFLRQHPEALLVAVHSLNKELLVHIPTEQLCLVSAVPPVQYLNLLNQLPADVGLAPLHRHPFNDCKSRLLVIEYMASRIVPLASNLAPYREALENTPFNDLLCLGNWYEKLERLKNEVDLRILKESLVQFCHDHFTINHSNWSNVFLNLI